MRWACKPRAVRSGLSIVCATLDRERHERTPGPRRARAVRKVRRSDDHIYIYGARVTERPQFLALTSVWKGGGALVHWSRSLLPGVCMGFCPPGLTHRVTVRPNQYAVTEDAAAAGAVHTVADAVKPAPPAAHRAAPGRESRPGRERLCQSQRCGQQLCWPAGAVSQRSGGARCSELRLVALTLQSPRRARNPASAQTPLVPPALADCARAIGATPEFFSRAEALGRPAEGARSTSDRALGAAVARRRWGAIPRPLTRSPSPGLLGPVGGNHQRTVRAAAVVALQR